MAIDYDGVSGIAQTVIAFNLAYIALNRFRYRVEIRNMFQEARILVNDMPPEFQKDLAWKNVESIAADTGGNAESWSSGKTGYFLYRYIFHTFADRAACLFLASFATVVLIVQAYDALIAEADVGIIAAAWIGAPDMKVNQMIFTLLLGGILAPIVFVLAGRLAVRHARKSMRANLAHLGERFRDEGGMDITAKLQDWGVAP